jgi:hypothetical protein
LIHFFASFAVWLQRSEAMVESAGYSLTEHQRKWLRRLQACEASGKSFTEYAAEQGFAVRALYDAKKALVKKGVLPRTQQKRFQRVQTVAVPADTKWRIRLANGVLVEFSGPVDGDLLSGVLNTVARLE